MNILAKVFGIYSPPIKVLFYHGRDTFTGSANYKIPDCSGNTIRWRHNGSIRNLPGYRDITIHRKIFCKGNRGYRLRSPRMSYIERGISVYGITEQYRDEPLRCYSDLYD